MSRIDWRRERRRITLPVVLLPPGGLHTDPFHHGTGLIDTGATSSGVTRRMADALALEPQGKRLLKTANGERHTERYIFKIGVFADEPSDSAAPSIPYLFDEVDGFELEDSFTFDALIGMDILSCCDFFMDRSGRCILAFGYGSALLSVLDNGSHR